MVGGLQVRPTTTQINPLLIFFDIPPIRRSSLADEDKPVAGSMEGEAFEPSESPLPTSCLGNAAFRSCPEKFVSSELKSGFVTGRLGPGSPPSPSLLPGRQHKGTLCTLLILQQHSFSNI